MESQEGRMDRTKTEPVASVQQEPGSGERIQIHRRDSELHPTNQCYRKKEVSKWHVENV